MLKKVPLGIRNKNPLNIRYDNRNVWIGLAGKEKGFCKFTSFEYGLRAAMKILLNYQKNGFMSIRDIITRWAPHNENDTESYIKHVSVALDEPDWYVPDLHGDDLYYLLCIMAKIESGYIMDIPTYRVARNLANID